MHDGLDGDLRPAPQLLQRVPLRPVQHPGQVQRWGALPGRVVRGPRTSGTSCSTTSFRSDSTAEHSSPYLPQWGPMEQLYTVDGRANGPTCKASTGPIRTTVDGRGRYVTYQGGRIWWTSATPAARRCRPSCSTGTPPSVAPPVLGYPKAAPGQRAARRRLDPACSRRAASSTAPRRRPTACTATAGRSGSPAAARTGPLRLPVGGDGARVRAGWIQRLPEGLHRRQPVDPASHRAQLRVGAPGSRSGASRAPRLPDR